MIGTRTESVIAWERGRSRPLVRHYGAIVRLLGFDPAPTGDDLVARLAATRRRLGLTVVAFARLAGFAEGTLTRWLNRSRQPHPSARPRISAALGRLGGAPAPPALQATFTELTRWRRTVPEGIQPSTFGEQVRALRIRLAWTQRELGDRLGVHRATVAAWERGEREPPSERQRHALSELRGPS